MKGKNLLIRIDEEVHRRFKTYCVERGASMQLVMSAMIIGVLNSSEQNKKGKK